MHRCIAVAMTGWEAVCLEPGARATEMEMARAGGPKLQTRQTRPATFDVDLFGIAWSGTVGGGLNRRHYGPSVFLIHSA
jgi:hypothetical protein